jgi:D-aminopeptidase
MERWGVWAPRMLSVLRIMAALLFMEHGCMKLFHFPAPQPGVPDPLPMMLTIAGVPVGVKLGRYDYKEQVEQRKADGSVVVVIATDAPLSDRNLRRLAERAFAGIARMGSSFSNGSGDYAVAFSTAPSVRRTPERRAAASAIEDLPNDRMSPLFQAVAEASEEAVLNALFAATTVDGDQGRIEALPLDRVLPMVTGRSTVTDTPSSSRP